jgi:Transposase DDE domain
MLSLQANHIADLYCWVDDIVPHRPRGPGKPPALTSSEVITILIWHTLVLKQKTLKDIHDAISLYHRGDFPHLPPYNTFVAECHRALPDMFVALTSILSHEEAIRIMDSTMLEVCKLHRVDSYKVAKKEARFGKNWQGWHYGFKLHASISLDGKLSGLALTGANVHDAQMEHLLLHKHTKIAVGDTLYGASVMRERMWRRYGTIIIAPPHPKQRKKITAPWQIDLLHQRSKIESVFDILKEHLHLVSSFPRSMMGYLVHYVRVLLSYQIAVLGRIQGAI